MRMSVLTSDTGNPYDYAGGLTSWYVEMTDTTGDNSPIPAGTYNYEVVVTLTP